MQRLYYYRMLLFQPRTLRILRTLRTKNKIKIEK